ncbi:MAG TPA: hypothetical protein VK589_05680 [Chryseolinea sp.]|nr:hypothetical protein [Chryseolinea sp.]
MSKNTDATSILKSNEVPIASRDLEIFDTRGVAIDTGIISNDSVPRKSNLQPNSQTEKEAKKKMYLEKKKAYMEAKKAYAATKDKRKDGFAVAGAIFFTVAFLCLASYSGVAIVFGILGLIASILGLKSRLWGMSVGVLIAAGVILTLYIILHIMITGSE